MGLNVNMEILIVNFFILLIGLYLIKKNICISKKYIIIDKVVKELKAHNLSLKQANDDVRAFRHDFNNIMQAFGGYIQFNDLNGLKKYYKDLTEDCNVVKNIIFLNSSSLNERNLYNSILKEIELAKAKGIEIIFFSLLELNKLKNYKVYRLLKIALMHSIKIAEVLKKKEILITNVYDEMKRKNIIVIANVYLKEEKSKVENFIKNDLELKEIEEICMKDRQIEFCKSFDDCVFVQEIRVAQMVEIMS